MGAIDEDLNFKQEAEESEEEKVLRKRQLKIGQKKRIGTSIGMK